MSAQVREDEIIVRVTRDWLENSPNTQAYFSTKRLAKTLELIEPDQGNDFSNWRLAIQKQVSRIMNGSQPFPAKWIDPWIKSLPIKYSEECRQQIAAAWGYLDAMPDLSGADGTAAHTAEIMNNFAEIIANNKPAHDGVYDESDDIDESNVLIDAHMKLIISSMKEIRRIHAGTGATGKLYDIHNLEL